MARSQLHPAASWYEGAGRASQPRRPLPHSQSTRTMRKKRYLFELASPQALITTPHGTTPLSQSQVAAERVALMASNMPPLPHTSGAGKFGDECPPDLQMCLAPWQWLGGKQLKPRYMYNVVSVSGKATVDVTVVEQGWVPEPGWLVALSHAPLCSWVWRVHTVDAGHYGVSVSLVTSTGRAHLLDTQVRR